MKKWIFAMLLVLCGPTWAQRYNYFAPGGALACTGQCLTQSVDLTQSGFVGGPLRTGAGGTGTNSTLSGLIRGGNPFTASELSGDCTTLLSNVITCTATQGVPFAPSATTDTTNASNITSGTLAGARMSAVNLAASGNGGVTGILPLANILTCATTQIVFDSSGTLVCSAGLTYNGSSTLTLGSAGTNGVVSASAGSTATSNGQQLTVQGGPGGATSGNSGAVALRSPAPIDGNAGNVNIGGCNGATTTATARNGCTVAAIGGNGVSGGTGGSVNRTAGNAGGGSGISGGITDTTGGGNSTLTSGNYTVTTASNNVGTTGIQASGQYSVTTGNVTGQGNTGAVKFNTGNSTNGGAGNVIFNLGTSGSPASCTAAPLACPTVAFSVGTQDYAVIDYLANFVQDPQTAFTSASNDGFFWVGGATGTPSGTPTAYNADYIHSTPLYMDRTAMRLWGYSFTAPGWKNLANSLTALPAHIAYTGSAPAVSACGTGPSIDANATDGSGTVTVGTIAAASCTVTFNVAYSTFNHCRVTSQSTIASFAYSYTLSAITVTGTSLVSDKFDYDCDGS